MENLDINEKIEKKRKRVGVFNLTAKKDDDITLNKI